MGDTTLKYSVKYQKYFKQDEIEKEISLKY